MVLSGDTLEPRDSHVTMTYNDRFLVIYGGITDSKRDNLVAIVDLESKRSRKIKNQDLLFIPPFLESHTCTLIGGFYYIYGGVIQEEGIPEDPDPLKKESNLSDQPDSYVS